MKNDHSFTFVAAVILTGVVLAFANSAQAASAPKKSRTKERAGSYESSNGKTGTFDSTTTRAKGETIRNGSRTNQDGETATRSLDRTWDKSTGTGTVNASATLANGKTESREGTLAKNADGSIASQGTITGPNGKTSTYAATTEKTDAGSSTTGTITGPNGKTANYETAVTKNAPGDITRETTVTGPNGKTSERVVATKTNGDGTGTRTVEVTKPDGTTETRTETFTVTTTP